MPTGNELVKLSDLGTAFNIKLDKDFSGLTAANTFSSTDIIPIAVTVNNVTTTYKLTGATLAAALAGIGNYLTTGDVIDDLTSTATNKPLSAAKGKFLYENKSGILISDVVTTTTNANGEILLNAVGFSGKNVIEVFSSSANTFMIRQNYNAVKCLDMNFNVIASSSVSFYVLRYTNS